MPGLVDLPTAEVAPDSEFILFFNHFAPHTRGGITFQALPRLTATFRYTKLKGFGDAHEDFNYFDRSFDLRFRLLNEGKYLPAVSVGLNDFIGTGLYSSEYIVATKSLLGIGCG